MPYRRTRGPQTLNRAYAAISDQNYLKFVDFAYKCIRIGIHAQKRRFNLPYVLRTHARTGAHARNFQK